MANFYADVASAAQPGGTGKVAANKMVGRIRYMESTYTVPVGGIAIADTIDWAYVVPGTKILTHLSRIDFAAGAASSTLNLGDTVSPARYLAATSVASAGTAPLLIPANGAPMFVTTDNTKGATDNCAIRSTVAGAALLAGQVITVRIAFVND